MKNVSEIIEISVTTEIRNRTYCLNNFCHNSLLIYTFEEKELVKLDWKNDSSERKHFFASLKVCGENQKFVEITDIFFENLNFHSFFWYQRSFLSLIPQKPNWTFSLRMFFCCRISFCDLSKRECQKVHLLSIFFSFWNTSSAKTQGSSF